MVWSTLSEGPSFIQGHNNGELNELYWGEGEICFLSGILLAVFLQ